MADGAITQVVVAQNRGVSSTYKDYNKHLMISNSYAIAMQFAFKDCEAVELSDIEQVKLRTENEGNLPVKIVKSAELKEKFFEYFTQQHSEDEIGDELITVFENGHLLKEWTFEEIRERAQVDF